MWKKSDTFQSSSTLCRASTGVCDEAEFCTGSSAQCPTNAVKVAGTLCRASTGPCDVQGKKYLWIFLFANCDFFFWF